MQDVKVCVASENQSYTPEITEEDRQHHIQKEKERIEHSVKHHVLFDQDTADLGVYRRKDGSFYAVLITEPTAEQIQAQEGAPEYHQIYKNRTKLLNHFQELLVEKPDVVFNLYTRKGCVAVNHLISGYANTGPEASDTIGMFSRFRIRVVNGVRQLHAEFKQTNQLYKDLHERRDELSINPAYIRRLDGGDDDDFVVSKFIAFFTEVRIRKEDLYLHYGQAR